MSKPSVTVLDYGSGNLNSASRALQRVGADVTVTADPKAVADADGLVVPGVGAFSACMRGLRAVDGPRLIDRRLSGGRPVLGICVGLQVMFEASTEGAASDHGDSDEFAAGAEATATASTSAGGVEAPTGLGQWPGIVDRLSAEVLPHMGWNTVTPPADSVLFDGIADEYFYFVHSYAAHDLSLPVSRMAAPKITMTEYGSRFISAVENGPLCATQFHPEKSADAGLQLLRNWLTTI